MGQYRSNNLFFISYLVQTICTFFLRNNDSVILTCFTTLLYYYFFFLFFFSLHPAPFSLTHCKTSSALQFLFRLTTTHKLLSHSFQSLQTSPKFINFSWLLYCLVPQSSKFFNPFMMTCVKSFWGVSHDGTFSFTTGLCSGCLSRAQYCASLSLNLFSVYETNRG